MFKTTLLCFLITTIISQAYSSDRIIGGSDMDIKDCPWQISILKKTGQLHCGGAIIGPSWIISAAHCFKDNEITNFKIRAGSSKLREGAVFEIKKIVSHPKYDSSKHECDVALVQLSNPLKFGPKVKMLNLPPQGRPSPDGEKLFVSGYGKTDALINKPSDTLKGIEVFILGWKTCKKTLYNITRSRLCVKAKGTGLF